MESAVPIFIDLDVTRKASHNAEYDGVVFGLGKNDQLEMTVFVRVRAKTSNNKGNRGPSTTLRFAQDDASFWLRGRHFGPNEQCANPMESVGPDLFISDVTCNASQDAQDGGCVLNGSEEQEQVQKQVLRFAQDDRSSRFERRAEAGPSLRSG